MSQAIGRKMIAQGKGSIVNIASIGGFIAYPHSSAYLASKGGVVQTTRSFALEWIGHGVRVNAIAPGLCETPLLKKALAESGSSSTTDFIQHRMLRDQLIQPDELIGGRDLPRERRRRQGHRPHARRRRRVPRPNEHRTAGRRARRGGRPRVPPRRQVHLRRDLAQPGLGLDAGERRPGIRLRRRRRQFGARLLRRLAARDPERRHRPRVAREGPAAAVDPARLDCRARWRCS